MTKPKISTVSLELARETPGYYWATHNPSRCWPPAGIVAEPCWTIVLVNEDGSVDLFGEKYAWGIDDVPSYIQFHGPVRSPMDL